MSNDTNMWSAGPTASPRATLPPRPDVVQSTSWAPTPAHIPAGSFQTAEDWKRIGAVLGIIASFLFFFTIPGWLTLAHYKKWKRGEVQTPYVLIWWGYGFSGLLLLAFLSGFFSGLAQPPG